MRAARAFEPYGGIYDPDELELLSGVVREALRTTGADLDQEAIDIVAKSVLKAYESAVVDRGELLEIAVVNARQLAKTVAAKMP